MIVTGDVFNHTWDWARATVPHERSTPASSHAYQVGPKRG
jgi:hypothetical protein